MIYSIDGKFNKETCNDSTNEQINDKSIEGFINLPLFTFFPATNSYLRSTGNIVGNKDATIDGTLTSAKVKSDEVDIKTAEIDKLNVTESAVIKGLLFKGGESKHNPDKLDTKIPDLTDNRNYIRGDSEVTGNLKVVGDLSMGSMVVNKFDSKGGANFKGGKSKYNTKNWGTHFPWHGDGKNYIRGDTEIRGVTNFLGDANFKGGKSKYNTGGWGTHFPWGGNNFNYIRGDTEIRGITYHIGEANFRGGRSSLNPKNWGTHFPYSNGRNYIRGDTELRGHNHNLGNFSVNGDIVFSGKNNWIFHTPDDNRRTIYIAPSRTHGKQDWNWPAAVEFYANGDSKFQGLIYSKNGFNKYSDSRVKINVSKIPNSLDKINLISGYQFNRTDNEEKPTDSKYIGVIAQDIEKVFPEAVSTIETEKIKDFKTVDYGALIAPLIEAVKELTKQNKELKERITKLEQKN